MLRHGNDPYSVEQVVLLGSKSSLELNNMLSAAHSVYDPNKKARGLN